MNKADIINIICKTTSIKQSAKGFAPANIALIKYWGKRDEKLNLPITSSLSLSLPVGTHTTIECADYDAVWLNGVQLEDSSPFAKRLFAFLDLFRKDLPLHVHTTNDIPTKAGLASSASGFAACTISLNELFGWHLTPKELSIVARLGSGSASRSIYSGFVEWHKGERLDGMDSFAEPFDASWPELRMDMWILSSHEKPIDSREAMKCTVATSTLYQAWPALVDDNLKTVKEALKTKNFSLLGSTCEQNALSMHATMLSAKPAISYFLPETITAMQRIWQLQKEGLELYFTMDAGPNLKLLYLEKDEALVHSLVSSSNQHAYAYFG